MLSAAFLFVRLTQRGDVPLPAFLLAVLLTQLSIALHNNWADRLLDARTKPRRPIPRGAVAPGAALAAAVALGASGIAVAFAIDAAVGALVTVGTACGYAYSAWLKRTVWSWLPFAIALPTLAVCSLLVAHALDGVPYILYAIGAPLVVAVHVADAAPDIDGDRRAGAAGLPARLGTRRALLLCWAGVAAALVLAAALWPRGGAPGAGAYAAAAALSVAIAISRRSLGLHRYLVLASAVLLGVDYVRALAG